MRPGPIRPGDMHSLQRIQSSSLSGFNEARADSPGRSGRQVRRPQAVARASMRPGPIRPGDNTGRTHLALCARASMRPGPIRPGDGAHGDRRRAGVRGFNEARADSPGRFIHHRLYRLLHHASMRPGPIRPGDLVRIGSRASPKGGASMRPGPIRPGDSPVRGNAGDCRRRFNEARADSPGRSLGARSLREAVLPASMRPGPIRPGDHCTDRKEWFRWKSFNEARADSPGRLDVTSFRNTSVSSLQ